MNISAQSEERLRQAFKPVNSLMLGMWRLGLGQFVNIWPEVIGRIMVIGHTGRKTGLRHQSPVNYTLVDGEVYCVAGFGKKADWYRNLVANPIVEVWLPDGWWAGIAEDMVDSPDRLALIREVLIASAFAGRMAGFDPAMTDTALGKMTASYRLVRIHRMEARTGRSGPGDLAWIWPLATMLLLPFIFFRRRRR
jgi:deazaflavin-dependent oxidoreductase (nitroreductase family)